MLLVNLSTSVSVGLDTLLLGQCPNSSTQALLRTSIFQGKLSILQPSSATSCMSQSSYVLYLISERLFYRNGTSVTGDFAPVLRAYVGLNYQENQLLGQEIQNVQPIWEADVLSLEPQTTVLIKRSSIVTQPTTYRNPVFNNVAQSVREVILPERRLESTVQSTYEAVVLQTQRPAVIQTAQVIQPRVEEDEVNLMQIKICTITDKSFYAFRKFIVPPSHSQPQPAWYQALNSLLSSSSPRVIRSSSLTRYGIPSHLFVPLSEIRHYFRRVAATLLWI